MPDAPPPLYNGHGTLQRDWLIVVRYDGTRDVLTLSFTEDGDRSHRSRQGASSFPKEDVQALHDRFHQTVHMLHTPRLF